MTSNRLKFGLVLGVLAAFGSQASAQEVGFQLNRYEPTPAGTWFFAVDHPWYSKTRYFAGGVTLDYAHNPLVFVTTDASGNKTQTSVIEHQLLGHVDLAVSFLNRFQISATLPVTFFEAGSDAAIGGTMALSNPAVGDPRLGLMIRLYGDPQDEAFSIHIGANLWIPLADYGTTNNTGDSTVRVLPKLILAGTYNWFQWTFNAGFLIRNDANLANMVSLKDSNGNPISAAGNELQLSAGLGYINSDRSFHIGPELVFATQPVDGKAFQTDFSSMEVLLGLDYLIGHQVMLGVAGGAGILRQIGTPDARVLFRIAYAPIRPGDRDQDGVSDSDDLCPDVPKGDHPDPEKLGCPLGDRDKDGVLDPDDACPDDPMGDHPDPRPDRHGCPSKDTDGDGVYDFEDMCIEIPQGPHPDPNRKGCPLSDRDGDGVYDSDDICPDVPMGNTPDPNRKGCPAIDTDGDGVWDHEDVCPNIPMGKIPDPDPSRKGCPAPDTDGDTIQDPVDACPTEKGAPDPDPKKNGCPGLVRVENGMIVILQPVYFATDKDKILPKSFPLLNAVANVFKLQPEIKKVRVEGHTDSRGKYKHNLDLSQRRAASVMNYIIGQGVDTSRLEAKGWASDKPVASNKTKQGQALNRRTEFHIVDPPPPGQEGGGGATAVPVSPGAAPSEGMPASETVPDKAGRGHVRGGRHGKAGKVKGAKKAKGGKKAGGHGGKRKKKH